MINPVRLGVNIDHVATLRQARDTRYPCPIKAALLAEQAGADGITLHLREDRRHIQDSDVWQLKSLLHIPMNFEMAVTEEMLSIAEKLKPAYACLVPEKREEQTTEGGLDVVGNFRSIQSACQRLQQQGIAISLFIEPDFKQIDAARESGATLIELHTGHYASLMPHSHGWHEALSQLQKAATHAHGLGLQVNAGHGLHYHNTVQVAAIPEMVELNIGHAIVAHAVFVGFEQAIKEMKQCLLTARL